MLCFVLFFVRALNCSMFGSTTGVVTRVRYTTPQFCYCYCRLGVNAAVVLDSLVVFVSSKTKASSRSIIQKWFEAGE